jgi:hypothetical protein
LQESKDNLQTMINQINTWAAGRNKSVDIIVQTMNIDPNPTTRPNYVAYYQGYRDVAAANHLLLIDNYATWIDLYTNHRATYGSYMNDQWHPNALGAANITVPNIQRALLGELPEPGTLVLLSAALPMPIAYAWRKRGQFRVC